MVCDALLHHIGAPVDLLHPVWIVSSEQLLAWTQNPTRVADLNNFEPFKCSIPEVDAKICNGIPQNEAGLLSHCTFSDFPFYTCVSDHPECKSLLLMVAFQYGCPKRIPTASDPNPEQAVPAGQQARLRCEFLLQFPDCSVAHTLPSTC